MAKTVYCPDCDSELKVPANATGKKVRCRACGKVFVVTDEDDEPQPSKRRARDEDEKPRRRARDEEEEDEEEEDEEEEDEEDGRPRRFKPKKIVGELSEWLKVRSGLTFILTSAYLACVSVFIIFLAFIVVALGLTNDVTTRGGGDVFSSIGLGIGMLCLGLLLQVMAYGLAVVGNFFCIWSPTEHGARILAIVSLVLLSSSVLVSLGGSTVGGLSWVAFVTSDVGTGTAFGAGPVIGGLGWMITFAEGIVFLFYLRAISLSLLEEGLARSVIYLLILGVISFLIAVVSFSLLVASALGAIAVSPGSAGTTSTVIGLLFLALFIFTGVLTLAWTIWYLAVLVHVRNAVIRRIESVRDQPRSLRGGA